MTTQVIFKIDPLLKKKAQQRAFSQGVTYSDVLQSATRAYVDQEFELRFVPVLREFTPTKKDLAGLKKAREDYKKGHYRLWSEVKHDLDLKHKIKS